MLVMITKPRSWGAVTEPWVQVYFSKERKILDIETHDITSTRSIEEQRAL